MRKPTQNLIIDSIAFALFLFLASTGILMYFILPPGSGAHGNVIWGLSRHDWGTVHFWIAISLLAVLALHLILHWNWIVCQIKGRPSADTPNARMRVAIGVAALILLVLLASAPLLSPVEQQPGAGEQLRRGLHGRRSAVEYPSTTTEHSLLSSQDWLTYALDKTGT